MYDSIIVGGGPAGLTASIYLRRANKSVLLIEKEACGGQMLLSPKIENYPGYFSISGEDFAEEMERQATSLGTIISYDEVKHVTVTNKICKVMTDSGEVHTSKTVIIAVGASHRQLDIPFNKNLIGNGISYCATCDGSFYENEDVAVIGGGDTALQYAIYLSSIASKVYLIHRRNEFRASPFLVNKIKSIYNIQTFMDSDIIKINGENEVNSIDLYDKKTGAVSTHPVKCVFVAIGQDSNLNNLDIEYDDKSCVFMAGDCLNKKLKQIITAAADGAIAATNAIDYLNSSEEIK